MARDTELKYKKVEVIITRGIRLDYLMFGLTDGGWNGIALKKSPNN